MGVEDKLDALRDDPGSATAAAALREIVHDLNNHLGSIVLETDTLDRLARVLETLGERQDDERLVRSAGLLADAQRNIAERLDGIQDLLESVSQTARDLRE